uniref:ACB domain-containing protein n=1 Tax=Caenorhabditis tropicalis TaxID=1561998 RepID=A0A1I7TGA6_9PELO
MPSQEELEEQYANYRVAFEQWKESNKNSVGTEAYNQYVAQFEQWEKDVESRKPQQPKQPKVVDKEAEAAAAYAQSQEAYVSHHLKAMEQQEMQQRAAAAALAVQQQQQMMQSMMMRQPAEQSQPPTERDMFMKLMIEGYSANFGEHPPPMLWGTAHKPVYDARDPLYAKFGERAAPAHQKLDNVDVQINPVPCWLLLDTLRDKKMVLAPHSNNCPPPPVPITVPPPIAPVPQAPQ